MTEELIKQKAEAEADKVIIGSGMDRASVIHLKHLLVTMYMQGATEATKELQEENNNLNGIVFSQGKALDTEYMINTSLKEQIEKMKCCSNCKHSRTEYEHCRTNKHEKWEIKEK